MNRCLKGGEVGKWICRWSGAGPWRRTWGMEGGRREGGQRVVPEAGAASGQADPHVPCRTGHVKDIGLFLKAVGAVEKW